MVCVGKVKKTCFFVGLVLFLWNANFDDSFDNRLGCTHLFPFCHGLDSVRLEEFKDTPAVVGLSDVTDWAGHLVLIGGGCLTSSGGDESVFNRFDQKVETGCIRARSQVVPDFLKLRCKIPTHIVLSLLTKTHPFISSMRYRCESVVFRGRKLLESSDTPVKGSKRLRAISRKRLVDANTVLIVVHHSYCWG